MTEKLVTWTLNLNTNKQLLSLDFIYVIQFRQFITPRYDNENGKLSLGFALETRQFNKLLECIIHVMSLKEESGKFFSSNLGRFLKMYKI